jgi:hypothetical protein
LAGAARRTGFTGRTGPVETDVGDEEEGQQEEGGERRAESEEEQNITRNITLASGPRTSIRLSHSVATSITL